MRVFVKLCVISMIVLIVGLYLILGIQRDGATFEMPPVGGANTLRDDKGLEPWRGGLKPIVVKIDSDGDGFFDVSRKGVYEIWMKGGVGALLDIEAVNIDDESYPVIGDDNEGGWVKIGSKSIKPVWGNHKIRVISRGRKILALNDLEIFFLSEAKRKGYEDLLKSKDISYFFYEGKTDISDQRPSIPIGRREFYIPKGGDFELKAVVRPKKEKVRAYAVTESYVDGVSRKWNFRVSKGHRPVVANRRGEGFKGGRRGGRGYGDLLPVFVFGEHFYPPQSLSYPLNEGMWRWMSNDGKVVLFNPLKEPMAVDISFSAASFKKTRNIRVVLNGELLKNVVLSGPEREVDPRLLSEVSDLDGLARISGKVEPVEIKGAILRPGVNRLIFRSIPSATLAGRGGRFNVSIVMRDDFVVKPSPAGIKGAAARWENKAVFKAGAEEDTLLLKDSYRGMEGDMSWVTRWFDDIDLLTYPLFILKYSWGDTDAQRMDVGFRIDRDGDGVEDLYFERAVSNNLSPGVNRFEIDILNEVYRVFPGINIDRLFLVGVDLFPHREWGFDLSKTIKEGVYTYIIKGIQVASKEASVVVVGAERFKKFGGSERARYAVGRNGMSLDVSFVLGGRKGDYTTTEFTMPLRHRLLKKSPLLILPFKLMDKDVQAASLWLGYDTSGDAKADRFAPVGVRVPLSAFRLITKDMKEPMLLYEVRLPDDFPHEYTTSRRLFKHFIVLKNGTPLSPVWDNDFRITKEQAQVNGKTLVINLPRDKDPDGYNYELYYIPDRWIVESPRFHGFEEYAFDVNEVREYLPERNATPVAIKVVLEGLLPTPLYKEKEYRFHLRAPMYTYAVLPRLKGIEQGKNMPLFSIDNKPVNFIYKETMREKDEIWLKKRMGFKEGAHSLHVREQGALEASIVEIKPVSSPPLTVTGQDAPKIKSTRINPTKYIVDVGGAKGPFTLIFSESYHEGWKAYVRLRGRGEVGGAGGLEGGAKGGGLKGVGWEEKAEHWSALWSAWGDRGNRREIEDHFAVNGFANGWIVPVGVSRVEGREKGPDDFQIVLEFKPQRLFEAGMIISMATLIVCMGYLVYDRRGKR